MKHSILYLFTAGLFLLTACDTNHNKKPNLDNESIVGIWDVISTGQSNRNLEGIGRWQKYDYDNDFIMNYWIITDDILAQIIDDGFPNTQKYKYTLNGDVLTFNGCDWKITVLTDEVMVLRYESEYQLDKKDNTSWRFDWAQYILQKHK